MEIPLQFKRLLEHVLEKLIYRMEPSFQEYMFNNEIKDYDEAPDITEREYNMGRSLITLIKKYLDCTDLSIENVKTLKDVCFVLKENLEKIECNYMKIAGHPLAIISGKNSFQRFVVDCLCFTVKFMTQCMKKFCLEEQKVFDNVIDTLEEFFDEKNVIGCIEKAIQCTDPFGKIPDEEYSEPEADFCTSIF